MQLTEPDMDSKRALYTQSQPYATHQRKLKKLWKHGENLYMCGD